eukprot:1160633-Pelagomonas_calceolata.AAC.4
MEGVVTAFSSMKSPLHVPCLPACVAGAQQHPKHNPGWLSRAAWTAAALHPQHAMPGLKMHPLTQGAPYGSGHLDAQADGIGVDPSGGGLRELMPKLVHALEGTRGRDRRWPVAL